MGLPLTDGDEDVPSGWRKLQLAATASAGVRSLNRTVLQGSGQLRVFPQFPGGQTFLTHAIHSY
jgi:hypothetical protein